MLSRARRSLASIPASAVFSLYSITSLKFRCHCPGLPLCHPERVSRCPLAALRAGSFHHLMLVFSPVILRAPSVILSAAKDLSVPSCSSFTTKSTLPPIICPSPPLVIEPWFKRSFLLVLGHQCQSSFPQILHLHLLH